ncbi:hypothetical protein QLQ75_gp37 [Gordonia phage Santhid]|uniref:Uncharacterized protein n=1 Tax=Gordonia phage Santhid TaxID=2927281 RepID=A0AAE9KDC6_9CAUD|nr:hypothetical protein QLQ75_gp37 [Gordonia phage Santhid]UOK18031.1 hypothetical protein SEA_SANTHID_37 [Gordonia phage Santhid]
MAVDVHAIDVDNGDLEDIVDQIIANGDDEVQHSLEDRLRLRVIRTYCPAWVVAEIERLAAADFERWSA